MEVCDLQGVFRVSDIASVVPLLNSVRMQENAGKMRTRITPNTDTFFAVDKTENISYIRQG